MYLLSLCWTLVALLAFIWFIIRIKTKKMRKILKVIIVLIMVSLILFPFVSCSVHHTVGGSNGWNLSSNLSLWSSTTSFFVNDSLVFDYTPDHDVIEVSKSDYDKCRINSPISTYNDENGQTVILLSQPGWRYFICGRTDYCSLGLKLSIHVTPELNNITSDDQPEITPAFGPHSSHGFAELNQVTFGKILLHLSITIMGHLLIAGV
ncbi:Uclacyanin 1 [Bienertia sinuspersici]